MKVKKVDCGEDKGIYREQMTAIALSLNFEIKFKQRVKTLRIR